ncbi:MAG: MFS transporter [Chthonomonadales bacterium]|nr:MFS transporter [Chthonomonadales bacterium]
MRREVTRSALWGILVTALLAVLIVIGSRNLAHFDAALVGYTFAILFTTFGITYRYAMWLQRPPTAVYWRRGWQTFLSRRYLARNLAAWADRAVTDVALNRFIWRRARLRWAAHWLIMWGCVLAVLITFPLVFGWLHFETVPGDIRMYRMFVFGFPIASFPAYSVLAFTLYHGLVWASFLVIPGVMIAFRRRMRDYGAAAVQTFSQDFMPLILLFAVSLSGLLLTVSYTWMQGYAYTFLAILHAVTVITTLLFLSFGKFFHVLQRPAQLGVSFYKDVGQSEDQAHCRRCGEPFTSRMHVEDLIDAQRGLGFQYEMPGSPVEHYQWICPHCRRALIGIAQGAAANRGQAALLETGLAPAPIPRPTYANPGLGQGPLGEEDRRNYHP